MAYLRFSAACPWYVFQQTDGRLAMWHEDHRASAPAFTRREVARMLESKDFSEVPGYTAEHESIITAAAESWIAELKEEKNAS